jgi:hypothetical protein
MPGTTRLEFYGMPLQDALAICAVDDDALLSCFGVTADAVAELRRAARWVVERHAEEVIAHYASPSLVERTLRVVTGGFDDDRT